MGTASSEGVESTTSATAEEELGSMVKKQCTETSGKVSYSLLI